VQEWQANGEQHYGVLGDDKSQTTEDIAYKLRNAQGAQKAVLQEEMRRAEVNYKVSSALNRIVEESKALSARAGEKPYFYNDARLSMFFQLKGFVYSFQHRTLGRIWHQMNNMEAPEPMYGWVAPAAMGYLLTAMGMEARQFLQYDLTGHSDDKPTAKLDAAEYMMHVAEKMGLTGLTQFGIDAAHAAQNGKSVIVNVFGGPGLDQMESAGRDIAKGHWGRPIAQALPLVNTVTGAQKNVATFINDATQ
jgi:hypothetical protein